MAPNPRITITPVTTIKIVQIDQEPLEVSCLLSTAADGFVCFLLAEEEEALNWERPAGALIKVASAGLSDFFLLLGPSEESEESEDEEVSESEDEELCFFDFFFFGFWLKVD